MKYEKLPYRDFGELAELENKAKSPEDLASMLDGKDIDELLGHLDVFGHVATDIKYVKILDLWNK